MSTALFSEIYDRAMIMSVNPPQFLDSLDTHTRIAWLIIERLRDDEPVDDWFRSITATHRDRLFDDIRNIVSDQKHDTRGN